MAIERGGLKRWPDDMAGLKEKYILQKDLLPISYKPLELCGGISKTLSLDSLGEMS